MSSSSSSSESTLSESTSSTTSSSSSSSSSIDSSSSSSIDSSSSSSGFEGWNRTKPFALGMSAINSATIKNRLAQTIFITEDYYSVGKVFCYLFGPYGEMSGYVLHMDIYTCKDDGTPSQLISSQTIDGSIITKDGWYSFDFDINGITPANGYLSFVLWQENGTENDYVLWGYSLSDSLNGALSWFSNDGIKWFSQDGILRGLKVVGNFDPYDLTDFRIVTPNAERECVTQGLTDENPINLQTKLIGATDYEAERTVIDNPSILTSIVVDSSGSMGWNDRFGARQEFIQKYIERIKQSYPSSFLFDMISFGAQVLDADSVLSDVGTAATINLDLSSPDRTTFAFETSGATAFVGDVYGANNYSFTVSRDVDDEVEMVAVADGNATPWSSGTLVKQSGAGDDTISYTDFDKVEITDTFIAYGFKNMEEDHHYNIGEISMDSDCLSNVALKNWQTLVPGGGIPLSIGKNGPKDSDSLDFVASDQLQLRKPCSEPELLTAQITKPAQKGDTIVEINDTSIVGVGDSVDFIDRDYASLGHTVTNVHSDSYEFDPGLACSIGSWGVNAGIVQQSNFLQSVSVNGLTVKLLVKDANITKSITFFLQTSNGLFMEWDFQPFKDWFIYNIYYLGDTAILPVSLFDVEGNPFPDGTKVIFYVNGTPQDINQSNQRQSYKASKDSLVGSDKVYLESTASFTREQEVDLLDSQGNIQTVTITEIGSDLEGDYIKFDKVLTFEFKVSNSAKVVPSITATDSSNASSQISQANLLPASLGLIDATPMYAGKNIDPNLLRAYDPSPVSPTTSWDDLNLDRDRIRNGTIDIPTINGSALLRILPITEDNLKTLNEQDANSERLIRPDAPDVFEDQLERTEDDFEQVQQSEAESVSELTTTTTTLLSRGEDYEIDNPVYSLGGFAESSMTSFAIEFEEKRFDGLNVPGVNSEDEDLLWVKSYNITPAVVVEDTRGTEIAKQYLEPFTIYFTPPISVYSEYSGGEVTVTVQDPPDENCELPPTYSDITSDGVYASGGDGFTINYVVTDRGSLLSNGSMTIRIYSNIEIDVENVFSRSIENRTRQDINVQLPKITTSDSEGNIVTEQPLTDIDAWIEKVENNSSQGDIQENDEDAILNGTSITNYVRSKMEASGYVSPQNSSGETLDSLFYTNPWEWTKADQFGEMQEFTVDIINGKASINIPSSDIVSLLMVVASVSFGDQDEFELIRSDLVPVVSPININRINPSEIFAEGGTSTYEISTEVSWMGDTIADNVVVSFSPVETPSVPAVSKTDNGWAGGVYLGPHEEVVMTCPSIESASDCPCVGEIENISVTVSYLGYERTVSRAIEWTGNTPFETEEESEQVYFKVNTVGALRAWSDGDENSIVTLSSDLNNDIENLLWIGEDGIDRLQGEDQPALPPEYPDGAPRRVSYSAPNPLVVKPNQERWVDGVASAFIGNLNSNIGNTQRFNDTNPQARSPWTFDIINRTSYRGSDGRAIMGVGVVSQPYYIPDASGYRLIIPYPQAEFKEPLGISLSIESYDEEFIRNGSHSPNVVANITWKDKPIKSKFIQNEGLLNEVEIDYPFPTVTFEAGTCRESNEVRFENGDPPQMKDTRNVVSGCLEIGVHPDISLASYSVKASLGRTDIYENVSLDKSIISKHTHSCEVNRDGMGETNGTIVLRGGIDDHTHVISDYIAESSGNPSHTHELRCVAVTKLDPLKNPNVNIAINGYVVYDPTGCQPYDPSWGEGNYTPHPSTFSDGNRMMFSTLYNPSVVKDRDLIVSISANNNYTALNVTDTERATNILVQAKFSEYSVEVSPGKYAIIPEAPVPDGTRVIFNIDTFKALSAENSNELNNLFVISPDKVREYMYVRVEASVYSEGMDETEEAIVTISSNLQWLPSVRRLLIEPTTDAIYLANAVSQISTVGASQIHDAVYMASADLINYQTENTTWKDSQKIILLLTDGDENTSEKSLDQSTKMVNFIDGECEVPVVPLRLGYTYSSSDVLMAKYAQDTCSNSYHLINPTSSEIVNVIDGIITDGTIRVNDGIYTNTIDLGSDNVSSTVSLNNILIPDGARITFRTRFSSDNITWTSWSEWFDSSSEQDFDLSLESKGRYFQYQIHLYGNSNFKSPSILSGIELCYYKVQNFTVFFQPIDLDINSDEYLASIHITHQATIPDTSTINYGYAQFDTTNIEDYSGVTQPLITPDRHTIILTRYNETFLTEDNKTFTAINGRWPEEASIEVYRVNNATPKGELIDSSTYAVNSNEGKITFYNTQRSEDTFVLCVYFDPAFRIICNVINYGPEAVVIDHIGVLYNITKRIPRDLGGNIIHTPINERL